MELENIVANTVYLKARESKYQVGSVIETILNFAFLCRFDFESISDNVPVSCGVRQFVPKTWILESSSP